MDEQSFIALAEELREVAVRQAAACLADADDVEDVAQEAMLRMWEKRASLQPDAKMLRSYTAAATRNICKDRHKVKRRHPLLRLLWRSADDEEEEYAIPSYDTPHSGMETAEAEKMYSSALRRLPYNWRKILTMRCEDEMTYAEIARILGTTESSVRGTLCKAKKRITDIIKQSLS